MMGMFQIVARGQQARSHSFRDSEEDTCAAGALAGSTRPALARRPRYPAAVAPGPRS